MLKTIRRILRKLVEYPLWAYGLECQVCQMTWINPESHYEEVVKKGTIKQHTGKITILKK